MGKRFSNWVARIPLLTLLLMLCCGTQSSTSKRIELIINSSLFMCLFFSLLLCFHSYFTVECSWTCQPVEMVNFLMKRNFILRPSNGTYVDRHSAWETVQKPNDWNWWFDIRNELTIYSGETKYWPLLDGALPSYYIRSYQIAIIFDWKLNCRYLRMENQRRENVFAFSYFLCGRKVCGMPTPKGVNRGSAYTHDGSAF